MSHKKKLIEVALPLEAINKASAREKSIRHGHPSTLHLWWARRPLAAARAVIFAQMVDDPSSYPDLFPTEKAQEKERKRLFKIIEDLVEWENTTNEEVLNRARAEIWQSWRRACAENADHPRAKELFDRDKLPAFHDPFAGGGSLPLEAQRLGLEAYASDLNPVAVLISKAMIEIPPKFAGRPPVNPEARKNKTLLDRTWRGAEGLAEDVRYYGRWMRDEAEKRIGHLYPKVEITPEVVKERPDLKPLIGQKLTVIAWLWARTVKSPNPAFRDVDVPLVSTFMLSTKSSREVWVEPVVDGNSYRFVVRIGKPKDTEAASAGTKLGHGSNFRCLLSGEPVSGDYIKAEGKARRLGTRLMAVVAESERGRVYISPAEWMESVAREAHPTWQPDGEVPARLTGGTCVPYGLRQWGDLFTPRQLVTLTTLSDLVQEVRHRVRADAGAAGVPDEMRSLEAGGTGAVAYADAAAVYLGLAVSRTTNTINALAVWSKSREQSANLFSRQAIPMAWDFPEVSPFGGAAGDFGATATALAKTLAIASHIPGWVTQADAQKQVISKDKIVSTDPPYYDNVGYADLSDFFYVWLRLVLKPVMPALFDTLAVPKAEELVATQHRHGGKESAEAFFLSGMTDAMHRLSELSHPAFAVTIYYAFKQTESSQANGTSSTGWETFLDAVIRAGFTITGTWPMRTERPTGVKTGTNALASSVILVCRQRPTTVATTSRREFVSELKQHLPVALTHLQRGNIAPVDLAQSAIGPGMAVFTRYGQVLDAEGQPLSVRHALIVINQVLDEVLTEQEGDFDAESRWALTWFDDCGFGEGDYGRAEMLSKAKNTAVNALVASGIIAAGRGKVRLLKPSELPTDWDPEDDRRTNEWEMLHHLIRVLEHAGEGAAAALVSKYGAKAEVVRELAYRLYSMCERKKRAAEALSYNGLVQSWPEIMRLAQEVRVPAQLDML